MSETRKCIDLSKLGKQNGKREKQIRRWKMARDGRGKIIEKRLGRLEKL